MSCYFLLKCKLVCKVSVQLVDFHANLLHGITVADSYCAVCLGLEVIGYAERSTDLILSSVTLSDISTVVILAVVFFRKLLIDLLSALIQLLGKRKHTDLTGASTGWK